MGCDGPSSVWIVTVATSNLMDMVASIDVHKHSIIRMTPGTCFDHDRWTSPHVEWLNDYSLDCKKNASSWVSW